MNAVGVGTRVLNFAVDSFFVLPLSYAAYRTWEWYAFYYHIIYLEFYIFWAAVTFLYYFIFEGIWRRTPGKWMTLTKVAAISGRKASLGQILLRCLLRVAGAILVDSLFLPITGSTLHDYASKTYVIEV